MVVLLMKIKPVTENKIKIITDLFYELGNDVNDGFTDNIIDISVDILYSILLAVPLDKTMKKELLILQFIDERLPDAEIKAYFDKYNKDADAIKKSLIGFIGDADKTSEFIKFTLKKVSDDNGGVISE